MRRRSGEEGVALIMLLGIMAALAVFAVMLVTVIGNQQFATAKQRDRTVSENYAEGSLDNIVQAAKTAGPMPNATTSPGTPWMSQTQLNTLTNNLKAQLGWPANTTIQSWVYDNLATVNKSTTWDSNNDGMMWLEVLAQTPQGTKTRVRVLLRYGSASIVSGLPRAVVYADTGITLLGTSDLYAVNPNGSAVTTPGSQTWVMTGSYFHADNSADLKGPGSAVQAVGVRANGAITPSGKFSDAVSAPNTVGLLSDYFNQSEQAGLSGEAQAANDMTLFNSSVTMYSSLASLQNAMTKTGSSPHYVYTAKANTDMGYSGNLTLNDGYTYDFNKLYVNGNFTISGNTTVNTTALRVGTPGETTAHTITISGATTDTNDHFGPIYATGDLAVTGSADVLTTNYLKASADPTASVPPDLVNNAPGPVWVRRLQITADAGSVFALGDTWVNGYNDTNNSTLFAGPSSGTAVQVWCPLLATTEQTSSTGIVNFGSLTQPMTYYMQCDNDGGYVNTCNWSTQGTFYGLMVLMEARVEFSGSSSQPIVVGAVFEGAPATTSYNNNFYSDIPSGDDITLRGATTIAYDQAVIDACINKSITTTTTTAQVVPGSWQQLSAN